jgi:hypothetical protein
MSWCCPAGDERPLSAPGRGGHGALERETITGLHPELAVASARSLLTASRHSADLSSSVMMTSELLQLPDRTSPLPGRGDGR